MWNHYTMPYAYARNDQGPKVYDSGVFENGTFTVEGIERHEALTLRHDLRGGWLGVAWSEAFKCWSVYTQEEN